MNENKVLRPFSDSHRDAWVNKAGYFESPDEDTPAVIYRRDMSFPSRARPKGTRMWFDGSGNCHRRTGPAVEHADGTCEYWLNGKQYFTEDHWLANGGEPNGESREVVLDL